jgi:hypothetical protein
MSGGRPGVPLDVCVEQIIAGDPYWKDGRGYMMRDSVLRQIAAEWREMLDEKLERVQAQMITDADTNL